MHVGIPTETKNNEFRVAITPSGVTELTRRGHEVLIQAGAGEGSAIADSDFKAAGAQLIATAEDVWAEADLVLKVKEPTPIEYSRMRRNQTLFTYLHLAASRPAPRRCWRRAPRRSPTRPCRPPTGRCRCWPR